MFENIGTKIKTLAKVMFWIGITASVITAIVMFVKAGDAYKSAEERLYNTLGCVFLFAGPISSWIGNFLLYGFGELIDNTKDIVWYMNHDASKSRSQVKADKEREEKLENLRTQGLITEEEYKDAMSKK